VHDADDGEDLIVEANRLSHGGRILIEEACPGPVAEDRDRIAARGSRIEPAERAAGQNAAAERLEIVAGHERRNQLASVRCHRPVPLGDHVVEEILPGAQLLVIAPAEYPAADGSLALLRVPANLVQGIGIPDGVRPEHVGVEHREDDSGQRQRNGQRRDGRECERPVPEQAAGAVGHVSGQLVDHLAPRRTTGCSGSPRYNPGSRCRVPGAGFMVRFRVRFQVPGSGPDSARSSEREP